MVANSKACQYLLEGQTYTPERYLGWAQFGLWVPRPRVVREFRLSEVPLAPWKPTFEKAAFRGSIAFMPTSNSLHSGATANSSETPHSFTPSRRKSPGGWQTLCAGLLLDTNLDRPRPWTLETEIPVFALALVQGEQGRRRWAGLTPHAPLGGQSNVETDCSRVLGSG